MDRDNKFKILIVHNFYQQPGGEDTVFRNDKKLLEDKGHEVITYTRDNSELKGNVLKKLLLPFITIFNPKTYFEIKELIKKNNIDIVHVHNTLSLISPSVFYAAIKMKTPVVQTLHNFRMQCMNALFYRDGHICEDCINKGLYCSLKYKCYRNSFFQTLALVLMTKVHRMMGIYKKINYICLTKFNKDKLLQLNEKKKIIDENRVYVKSNFVFDLLKPNGTNKTNSNNKSGYYLYVGRLDEIKGIDVALEAFSKMPDRELHVIGSGGEEYKKIYNSYSNIKFLGQLSHDEALLEMRNGNALIYPTKLYEGQPISIIEAYANELPVIASDIGNAREMVKDKIAGLHFNCSNIDSLISKIVEYENLDINNLKKNSKNECIEKYTDYIGYKNIIEIYKSIAG